MHKMNSKSFFAALSLMLIVSACGKSMSLQMSGPATVGQVAPVETPTTIDTTKLSQTETPTEKPADEPAKDTKLTRMEELQSYSEYDLKDLKIDSSKGEYLRRSTIQVPPTAAVSKVLSFLLSVKDLKIEADQKITICLEDKLCKTLENNSSAEKLNVVGGPVDPDTTFIDLVALFGLGGKSDTELMEIIHSSSTDFANPNYRKFRFKFEGVTFSSGNLILQVITNDQLPKDFATAPSCYVHGDEDIRELGAPEDTSTKVCSKAE